MSEPAAGPTPAEALRRRSREALSALALQFLLGMAANLIGEPKGTFAIVVDTIIVILHIVVAIGLVVVSIRVLLAARAAGADQRLAVWGIVVIVITLLAGVGTMVTGNEWASYVMAVGFLVAAALYGGTFFASYDLSRASRA